MTEDDGEEVSDIEDLMESIREAREERKEQVSFEWVETVREAGERYRDIQEVETVAEEMEQSVETTREALTVYRLIFENPSDVAMKATDPSRAYFSLEQDIDDEYDPEDVDEPAEELLREYVGGLYLDHDIEELPVGDPPDETTPPRAVEPLDIDELFPSFEIPTSTLSAVGNAIERHHNHVSTVARIANSDAFKMQSSVAQSLQRINDLPTQILAQSLSPLIAHRRLEESMAAVSAVSMLSDVVTETQMPSTVLADLSAVQSATSADALASSYRNSALDSPVDDQSSKIDPDPEVDSDSGEAVEAEVEPPETTDAVVPEFGFAETTVDATLPDADKVTTELTVEIPALVVQSILSSGKAYRWFSNLSTEYQDGVVGAFLVYVAISTGNPAFASAAAITAPAVRHAILDSGEEDVTSQEE